MWMASNSTGLHNSTRSTDNHRIYQINNSPVHKTIKAYLSIALRVCSQIVETKLSEKSPKVPKINDIHLKIPYLFVLMQLRSATRLLATLLISNKSGYKEWLRMEFGDSARLFTLAFYSSMFTPEITGIKMIIT